MLKEVYIQGNIKHLKLLYETYKEIKDERELIKIAGRIIQSGDESIDKAYIVDIFDEIYNIVSKQR